MYFTYNVFLIQTIMNMEYLIENLKKDIWEKLRNEFVLCNDIGNYDDNLFYKKDIPRVFYEKKVVLPEEIFFKAIKNLNNMEIKRFIMTCFILSIGLKISLNERFSEILADSYCFLEFESIDKNSTQYEQIFFKDMFKAEFRKFNFKNLGLALKQNMIKRIYLQILDWQKDNKKYAVDINSLRSRLS